MLPRHGGFDKQYIAMAIGSALDLSWHNYNEQAIAQLKGGQSVHVGWDHIKMSATSNVEAAWQLIVVQIR